MLHHILRPLLLLAGPSLCLGLALLFLSRPDSQPLPAKPAGALRVCAANLNYGNPRPSEATRRLLAARPDILLLVEWTGANADPEALRRGGYRLALGYPRPGTHGLALYVREGIAAKTRLHEPPLFSPCHMPFLVSRLHVDGRDLAFLGVHAPPPVPSCRGTNGPYLEALAALVADGRLREDLGHGRRGDPLLLAGDLNAMPSGPALAALRQAGFTDLLRLSRSRTLKPTWSPLPSIPSFIRLDYILAGPALKPLSAWTLDIPASDHRAVLADIALPPP